MGRLPRVLSEAERQRLLDYLQEQVRRGGERALRDRALIYLMVGAGLRVAEAVRLRIREVDIRRGQVRVTLGKGARDRVVPIDGPTAAAVGHWALRRQWDQEQGMLLCRLRAPHRGQPMTVRNAQKLVARIGREAGLEEALHPHTLRHTYATELLRRGYDIREVQELLGHASVATTMIYTHVDPARLSRRVQELGVI